MLADPDVVNIQVLGVAQQDRRRMHSVGRMDREETVAVVPRLDARPQGDRYQPAAIAEDDRIELLGRHVLAQNHPHSPTASREIKESIGGIGRAGQHIFQDNTAILRKITGRQCVDADKRRLEDRGRVIAVGPFRAAAQGRFEEIGLGCGTLQIGLVAADEDWQAVERVDDDGSRVIAGQVILPGEPSRQGKDSGLVAGRLKDDIARLARFQSCDLRFAGRLAIQFPFQHGRFAPQVARIADACRHGEQLADRKPRAVHAQLFDRQVGEGRFRIAGDDHVDRPSALPRETPFLGWPATAHSTRRSNHVPFRR